FHVVNFKQKVLTASFYWDLPSMFTGLVVSEVRLTWSCFLLPLCNCLKCNVDVTTPAKDVHGVLEERDPSYDDMLKHMAGRITTKPGGRPEMGEVSILVPKCSPMVIKC